LVQIPPELIVGVSGIRGVVGQSLSPEVVTRFALAYAATVGPGALVVGRDSRPSGVYLTHAVLAGLLASGREVIDLGIVPTPTVGRAVREFAAAGGVQITASHNPAAWNGLKLFGPDGAVMEAADGERVRRAFLAGQWTLPDQAHLGRSRADDSASESHVRRVLSLVAVQRIRQARLRVVLDGNGGAGGPTALRLLEALGCTVQAVGCEPDGRFQHDPEPTPAHLHAIAPLVPRFGAAVGFALDPDADRLALIDETGQCLSEELTLALAVWRRLQQQPGPVAINLSTSRVVEDLAARFGCPTVRSPVGEANVVRAARQVGAVIAGEGNGGVIDPRVGWVRDPFIGIGLILELLADPAVRLSRLVASLPRYTMLKRKVHVQRDDLPRLYAQLKEQWPAVRVDEQDGLRLDTESGWVHIRPSNTEPIVRIIAEAPTAELAELSCHAVERLCG
jgi:phosphomannomutase